MSRCQAHGHWRQPCCPRTRHARFAAGVKESDLEAQQAAHPATVCSGVATKNISSRIAVDDVGARSAGQEVIACAATEVVRAHLAE